MKYTLGTAKGWCMFGQINLDIHSHPCTYLLYLVFLYETKNVMLILSDYSGTVT